MSYTWNDCQKAIARIYNSEKEVQGTGFLVSSNYLLTCAHVVIDALGPELNGERETIIERPTGKFLIDFPRTDERNPLSREGEVIIWNPCPSFFDNRSLDKACFGEDVALVKLDQEIPKSEIRPVILSGMDDFRDKPEFDTYGFPQGNDNGEFTEGKILGQNQIWLQLQGQHDTLQIRFGYSGSPICCGKRDTKFIVGMTVASAYYSEEQSLEKNKAYAIPGKALREIWLKQGQLIEYLMSCEWKSIKQAYDNNRPRDWNSKQPETTIEVVRDLYQYYEEHKDKDNTLINFVIYLIVQFELSESLKCNLRQWAEIAFEVNEAELAEKCDQLKKSRIVKQEPEKIKVEPLLWIILNEDGTADQYKIEAAYFIEDSQKYNRENKETYKVLNVELLDNIQRSQLTNQQTSLMAIQEIIEQIPYSQSIHIEIFLPYKSLDLKPDTWLIEDDYDTYPLGKQYPVVIRVLERLGYKKNYKYASLWKEKWKQQHITQLSKQGLISCELSLDEISRELDREEKLGICCSSPIKNHPKKPNVLIMQRGLPIALWFREKVENCCGIDSYQRLLETSLRDLSQELRHTRNAEPENEKHLARHINLIWDDPTKLPHDAPTFSDETI